MTISDLITEFDIVIDTPKGLTELRSLILGLAVRGKLVPQDPNDEPASDLLKKIEAEKERLYEEGEIRKPRSLKPQKEEELPFELPKSWQWCQIGDIAKIQGGGTPKTSENQNWSDNGIPWVTPADLNDLDSKFIHRGRRDISEAGLSNSSTFLLPKGSVLFSSRAPIGYVAIAGNDICTNQGFQSSIPYLMDTNDFIYYYLKYVGQILDERASGTTFKEVSGTFVANVEIPLPPLAEQHRIVQKIESLFAEVDELEAKLSRQTKLDEKLQLAVNAEVQKAPDADASKSAWNFITSNFNTLFHTPEAIDNLKKNILNEAVRGRLISQNPKDEPAAELLKKIEAEKQRLYEEGEIRKPKDLPPVKEDEIPFEVPESWEWCKFEELCEIETNLVDPKNYQDYPHIAPNNIEKETGRLLPFNTIKVDGVKSKKHLFKKNRILYSKIRPRLSKLVMVDFIGLCSADMYPLNPYTRIDYFFFYMLSSTFYSQVIETDTRVAMPKTNQSELNITLVPLPPLEEQHRIVQRIEDLFAICDQFIAQLEKRQKVNERLVKGLVSEVLEVS